MLRVSPKEGIKDFPSYGWIRKLSEGRYFSGSAGTDPHTGCLQTATFHYKIWKKDDQLCAGCYVKMPQGEMVGAEEMSCDCSEENVEVVKKWICERADKYKD